MNTYAIIETGGKQYRVEQGTRLQVESLPKLKGEEITLEKVLFLATEAGIQVGKPTVAGAKVTATVTAQDRHAKIIVFKKRSKKTYKKTQGHRQNYTELVVKSISAN
jgi:large subunit ribosomal protein L21